jgi:Leucine-rich repeat (LRR) protein/tetratricopeptide (TPR) repeat protein
VEGYEIVRPLGEGGMGVVYLAIQKQPIQRQVAVKVVKAGMDSKQVIARFEAEEQALALLDHPNVAQVYDAGTAKDGHPYFCMEYVNGPPITEYCDTQKLSINERLRLFIQVCEGVQHAHQKGIVHRDLKPSNVLISTEDSKPLPKIIDFGVAKALTAPLTERTLFTEQGQLLGTPEYMSPEQAELTHNDIDTRSDVYSLGVMLYEFLTGALPFDHKVLQKAGFLEIMRIIREADPLRPSARLSSLGAEAQHTAASRKSTFSILPKLIRGDLDWIVMKALDKDRARRYGTAAELAGDVLRHLNHEPVQAGPPTRYYKLRKFARRHQAVVAAITAVLMVLVGGSIVSTVFAIGQARQRARAERQIQVTQAVADFLNKDLIASVDPIRSQGGPLTVREILDTAGQEIEGEFVGEPLVEASVRRTLGDTYRAIGELERAERHLKRACQLYQKELGDEDTAALDSINSLGGLYWAAGRYGEAEPLLLKTYQLKRRLFGEKHDDTIRALRNLVGLYDAWGKIKEGQEWRARLREKEPGQLIVHTIPEDNLRIPAQWEKCAHNMRVIHQAINRYLEDEERLPNWLSDLVPQYLSGETLLCPVNSQRETSFLPDPKLPCSYSWELALSTTDWDPTGRMLNREWKMQQVRLFGNVVPLIRCHHHGNGKALNVSMGGQLYWSGRDWELLFKKDYLFGDERKATGFSFPLQGAPLPVIAKAILGTVKDSDIVRQAIRRQLGTNVGELTHEDYQAVERLDLSSSEITYLEFLQPMRHLRSLHLHDTLVKNIEPLADLTDLQELRLSRTSLANLEPLAALTKLQKLWIDGTQAGNLEPLKDLTALELLDLGYTPVENLEPLGGLVNLKALWLPATQIQSLEGLERLVHLEALYLWDTHIIDLEPLASLTNLRILNVSRTDIHDLEPLSDLGKLQNLQLAETRIDNLEPLSHVTSLQRLYIRHSPVTDLGPLVSLGNLQVICLANTQVQDLSPLKTLVNLKEIHLSATDVGAKQVTALQEALPSLKVVQHDGEVLR